NGVFQLQFGNKVTKGLSVNSSAAQVAAALNALPNIGGGVTLTLLRHYTGAGAHVYTLTSVRADMIGIDQPQITALVRLGAVATTGTVQNGNAQTVTNLAADNMLRGAVTLGTARAITVDTRPNSRLGLWGNISGVGAITKNNTGKLILGGN